MLVSGLGGVRGQWERAAKALEGVLPPEGGVLPPVGGVVEFVRGEGVGGVPWP